jgi:hypothetical protein
MFHKRKSVKYPATLWEKIYGPVLFAIVLLLGIILTVKDSNNREYNYKVTETRPSNYTTVSDYPDYTINATKEISIKNIRFPNLLIFPAHTIMLDVFYLLYCFCINMIVIFLVYQEHKKGLFKSNISKYTKILAAAFLLLSILNTLRWINLNTQILKITNGNFKVFQLYDSLARPEFWIFIVLTIITRVLKQAEILQKEQDLTI